MSLSDELENYLTFFFTLLSSFYDIFVSLSLALDIIIRFAPSCLPDTLQHVFNNSTEIKERSGISVKVGYDKARILLPIQSVLIFIFSHFDFMKTYRT